MKIFTEKRRKRASFNYCVCEEEQLVRKVVMGDSEEIVVLFHAALLGRTDVVQNALTSLRKSLPSNSDVANAISVGTKRFAYNYWHTFLLTELIFYRTT